MIGVNYCIVICGRSTLLALCLHYAYRSISNHRGVLLQCNLLQDADCRLYTYITRVDEGREDITDDPVPPPVSDPLLKPLQEGAVVLVHARQALREHDAASR